MSYEVIGWLIAIVVFIAAEAATVALVSVWFIGGAVCALAAAILGAGLAVQLAVFLAFVCPIARKKWTKKPERMNADRLVGQTATVTETIDACADTGAVRVSGVLWTAKCATGERIEKGRHVTIERVEGAKLYVKPAEMPCEKA